MVRKMKKSLKIVLIALAALALLVFLLFFAPKPIRIFFRVIVILFLVIILAVLLCPIHYSANAAFDEKPDVHVLIKWMRFIKIPVDYNEQGVQFAVKLFGFQLVPRKGKGGDGAAADDDKPDGVGNDSSGRDDDSAKDEAKTDPAEAKADAENGKEGESKAEEKPDGKPDDAEKKDGEASEDKKEGETAKEGEKTGDEKEDKASKDDEESEKQPFLEKIGDKLEKVIGIWDNTMGALNDEEIQLNLFMKRRSTKHSLEWTKQLLLDLCNHARPRELKGELELGLDDPSMTGYISILASFCYDVYINTFDFYPNFEEKVIRGRVEFAGRFVLGYILIKCVWLYLGRPFKNLFSRFKLFKVEPYGGREFRLFIKNALALKKDTMKNISKIKDGITNYG